MYENAMCWQRSSSDQASEGILSDRPGESIDTSGGLSVEDNAATITNVSSSKLAAPSTVKSILPIPKDCIKREPCAYRHISKSFEVEYLVAEGVHSAGVVLVDLQGVGE